MTNKENVFRFLDILRRSGKINMLRFEANKLVQEWM